MTDTPPPEDSSAEPKAPSTDSVVLPKPPRWKLALVLGPIIVAVIASYAATGFLPKLIDDHPLGLLALNSRLRNIVFVTNKLDFWPLLLVALSRRVTFDPLFFSLGRMYGRGGVKWVEKKMGDAGEVVRLIDTWFHKLGWLFVMVYPGEIVCTLAGATGMAFGTFILLDILGTLIFVTLAYQFASFVSGPLTAVTDWIGDYSLRLTIVTVIFTAGYFIYTQKTGKSELETLDTFEKELEESTRIAAREVAPGDDSSS